MQRLRVRVLLQPNFYFSFANKVVRRSDVQAGVIISVGRKRPANNQVAQLVDRFVDALLEFMTCRLALVNLDERCTP